MKTTRVQEPSSPSGVPCWWTGIAPPADGAACAFAERAFDARREIARELGVSEQDVEMTQC